MDYGDPTHGGEHSTTIEIKYTDAQGQVQTKKITGTLPSVTSGMTAVQKKDAAKGAVDAELAKAANQVNGNPLASTGGVGDHMSVAPSGDVAGSFSDVKITSVTTEDKETQEDDKIIKPATVAGLGILEARGTITGLTGSGGSPSYFNVITDEGLISIALSGSTTKAQLLASIVDGLEQQGITTWVDSRRGLVLIEVDGTTTSGVGCSSSDSDLTAVATVIVQE